ncbi:hypothetical protein H257_06647 [Aphanomyces astaci]|uniref:Uncharacterized protein n=1 Tax=Aphanomyces astaci TaxID=112090 RepID=W4GKW6_APHAT|nr:hypothetical protein H257_06647 [Aphanomyces astaci]ETV80335.1 hypothetical protein H257_06647 [Aphanomyces astaci]|eukprot:XP_009830259.1 hypothetical protein H257_06647 [Aphanomyces astaci]
MSINKDKCHPSSRARTTFKHHVNGSGHASQRFQTTFATAFVMSQLKHVRLARFAITSRQLLSRVALSCTAANQTRAPHLPSQAHIHHRQQHRRVRTSPTVAHHRVKASPTPSKNWFCSQDHFR